ncbi:thiol:disulfide interchange protein DsbA [Fulvimonas soli]|jgi:thiol:disulfide interchange protein DsbA|uniref:Thiol:disulfide interchange protein DsbA n=1 Tax=Fulvimonas soli TaxID=155197 RepID=A0A316I9B3_9GAMM|nr:thiol:disulfide interchange protein DsbA/DsbL [Fulvimonas soli]PWK83894.1 thiol:disulfide interchange protein DsbA [Fulvimonas soli]
MFKRLPILCTALFALAACSSGNDGGAGTAPAPAGTAATAPAAAPAAAPASSAPAAPAGAAAPAAAGTTPAPAPAATAAAAAAPAAAPFVDDGKWVEGKDYFRIEPAQPKVTSTDKIEVVEVFSYGCPACNAFHLTADQIARQLPASAVMVYLPASFIPQENWPMLQRAYLTAQALGVADKAMDAMYDAVWGTRELSAMKPGGDGLKPMSALPTIEDAAKVYAKFGADPKEFVAVANSFTINTKMKRADELVKAYGVEGTPTIVVDGKYRFSPSSVGAAQSIELAKWLVAREAAGQ